MSRTRWLKVELSIQEADQRYEWSAAEIGSHVLRIPLDDGLPANLGRDIAEAAQYLQAQTDSLAPISSSKPVLVRDEPPF